MQAPQIPIELQARLHGYGLVRVSIGRSGDGVFRLEAAQRPPLIIKVSDRMSGNPLRAEAARLDWLRCAGILTPRILDVVENGSHDWLLMESLPGANAAVSSDEPAVKVHQVAKALVDLHGLKPEACPFDETLTAKLARAEVNIQTGRVDEGDFDEDHQGKGAGELFREMLLLRPMAEDIVVTHGDACLPNLMLEAGRFSGFVDCGRLGRSDRYQDLSLACRSIRSNLGPEWIAPFLRAYGLAAVDEQRMRFYRMLDEFF